MAVDLSAVARVLGIETKYVDLRSGNISFLPQRIALLAQGSSGVVYPTTKWQATSAGEAAAKYGLGSPIHLALRELFGQGGDGVGSIPVTVYPLAEGGGSTAAVGNITPSGTATSQIERRFRIGGVLSQGFTILSTQAAMATAAFLHAALRKIGDAINTVPHMPAIASYTYGTVTGAALVGTGNGTLGTFTTLGNPKPGVWRLQNVQAVVNGGVWSLTDPDGLVVSSTLTQTIGAGAVTPLSAGGLGFSLTDGTTDFGLGAYFDITVPATNVVVTSKWKGASANAMLIELIGDTAGLTFALTQPTGGTVNPSVQPALDQIGNVWETLVLNTLNIDDTVALDAIKDFGEGRWGELVHKPFVCFTGNTGATVSAATAISNTRTADRVNAQLTAPGSPSLPFVVAARQLARIAKVANDNPAQDYGSQRANGLVPGTDAQQWNYAQRDQAVKAGSSTSEARDGVVTIGDVVTFWRPVSEDPPAYRYVVDIVRAQNVIYNTSLIFARTDWDGAPLIPDSEPTVNPTAKQPKMANAELAGMIDSLADNAIISDRAGAKKSIVATISSSNPKRLDVRFTTAFSGNTNIVSVAFQFGFYFGTPLAA